MKFKIEKSTCRLAWSPLPLLPRQFVLLSYFSRRSVCRSVKGVFYRFKSCDLRNCNGISAYTTGKCHRTFCTYSAMGQERKAHYFKRKKADESAVYFPFHLYCNFTHLCLFLYFDPQHPAQYPQYFHSISLLYPQPDELVQ